MSYSDEHQVAAFSDLMAESRGRVYGYIYAMLHNMSDAEDIYQQTTVLMWEKFGEFRQGTDFTSWALKIAYYNVKNFQRAKVRARVFFSDAVMEKVATSFDSAGQTVDAERIDALVECLEKLPEKHRKLLEMRYDSSASIKQLAELESKSEAAVSMMLMRLRKLLLRCIRSHLMDGA